MMNREQIELELREKYPQMFLHYDLKPGEVFLGLVIEAQEAYPSEDMPSARIGNPTLVIWLRNGKQYIFFPVFVQLEELITALEGDGQYLLQRRVRHSER